MFEHGGDTKLIIRKVFVAKKILKNRWKSFMTVMKKLEQWKIAGENAREFSNRVEGFETENFSYSLVSR